MNRLFSSAVIMRRPFLREASPHQGAASVVLRTRLSHYVSSKSSATILFFAAAASIPFMEKSPSLKSWRQTTTTLCDASPSSGNDDTIKEPIIHHTDPTVNNNNDDNPLWPSGVSADMVNKYVDEILADPNINMRTVPDSIERIIYVSTVRVTLNAVYEALSSLHGTELLGHKMQLVRLGVPDKTAALDLAHNSGQIDTKVLESLADELLKSKAINQRWIPDIIERQVYANCLRIVFTILDKLADTMSFRLCGHELSLSFEPVSEDRARELARKSEQPRQTQIDSVVLDAIVEETVRESQKASPVAAVIAHLPLYESFLKALHKTLYSLILGIVDDILSKTEIMVLEESIQIKLIPERRAAGSSSSSTAAADAAVINGGSEATPSTPGAARTSDLEQELEQVKGREVRARYTAGALAVVSVASLAAAVTSRRSS